MTIYGIPGCDSTKMALRWLKKNKLQFEFHDYKLSGISADRLQEWAEQVGWETLLNRKSATWRGLLAEEQSKANSQAGAIELMVKNTSLIKRPLIEHRGKIMVGLDTDLYNKKLI
jgi:arsenate reductase